MGYSTDFEGKFNLDKPLEPYHAAYLIAFSNTRRMKRSTGKLQNMSDPFREAVKLPLGNDGEYFVGGDLRDRTKTTLFGIIIVHHQLSQGFGANGTPSEDLKGIEWSGAEKFYDYVEWLQYLVDHFLKPWGYVLSGQVKWQGEDPSDLGVIRVKNNVITAKTGFIVYS